MDLSEHDKIGNDPLEITHFALKPEQMTQDPMMLQEKLASRIITTDSFGSIKKVCGVDVSYKDNVASTCAVIVDRKTLQMIESVNAKTKVNQPYQPGLLFLREAEPAFSALHLLQNDYDLLLVDGNGQLHPRKCGLACHLGLSLDKPTIGVAKSLLCGKIKNNRVILDSKIMGAVIKNRKNVFVSVGHKIGLRSATKIVQELIKKDQWLPEPLRLADHYSKTWKNKNVV
ncbi:MAG: endonuclease V [Candidatus Nitrosotenuis sp.]